MGNVNGTVKNKIWNESSLNDEAGKLLMDSYDEHARRARLLATVHGKAIKDVTKKMRLEFIELLTI